MPWQFKCQRKSVGLKSESPTIPDTLLQKKFCFQKRKEKKLHQQNHFKTPLKSLFDCCNKHVYQREHAGYKAYC